MLHFRKLYRPLENLAFVSLMAGINAIFALFGALVPLGGLFVMIFLPLASAFVALLCLPRYSLVYFFAAIGLSIALSAWNFQNTLFYVIPSIIVGLVYGYLVRTKVPLGIVLFALALLYIGVVYMMLPIINALYGTDPVEFLLALIGKQDSGDARAMVPAGIFVYGALSSALPSFIIQGEFEKFGVDFAKENKVLPLYPVLGIVFVALALSAPFYLVSLAYISVVISFYFALMGLQSLIKAKNIYLLIPIAILLFASIYVSAACYSHYPDPTGVCLYSLIGLSLDITSLVGAIIWARRQDA